MLWREEVLSAFRTFLALASQQPAKVPLEIRLDRVSLFISHECPLSSNRQLNLNGNPWRKADLAREALRPQRSNSSTTSAVQDRLASRDNR